MKSSFSFILICVSFLSCGDYAAMEQAETNRRTADSFFLVHKDSLSKQLESFCDSVYEKQYDIAIDSIREEQLEKILELSQ